jgi:hypothetical protein
MNCYAWNIPQGCYDAAMDANAGCPTPTWFWIALAAAGGLLLMGGGKKRKVRAARAKRK